MTSPVFKQIFEKIGITLPEVLLPAKGIDMQKWSVVACDQYTSQPQYWEEAERFVGDSPSTLKLILPEAFLENGDLKERINSINKNMQKYLDEGILISQGPCFIYADRQTSRVKSRKGLVLAVDLEKYDYTIGSRSLIRATEKTVAERLPPRIKIRENAPLEVPHIQLLIDDPEMTVFSPIEDSISQMEKVYDFDLMMNGGHIKGYKVSDESLIRKIANSLEKLMDPEHFSKKYGIDPEEKGIMLFAVGDGNHSLASAKAHWEKKKTSLPKEMRADHPARYAMVEVINVHDKGLIFEPIHRVLFNVDYKLLIDSMIKYYSANYRCFIKTCSSGEELNKAKIELIKKNPLCHVFPFVSSNNYGMAVIENAKGCLDTSLLQEFLDRFLEDNPSAKIDYIHGDDIVTEIGTKPGNMGFYLSPMDKSMLFKTVLTDGTLPRKTFSMGEAEEKRYYLECRKII